MVPRLEQFLQFVHGQTCLVQHGRKGFRVHDAVAVDGDSDAARLRGMSQLDVTSCTAKLIPAVASESSEQFRGGYSRLARAHARHACYAPKNLMDCNRDCNEQLNHA